MKEIVVSIPEELQNEVEQLKTQKDMEMSYEELYQYLIKLGLSSVLKGVSEK